MTEVRSSSREHWAETASRIGKLGVKIHKIWGNWRKSKGLGILVGEEDVKGEAQESALCCQGRASFSARSVRRWEG